MPFLCVAESVVSKLSAAVQTALAGALLPSVQLLVCALTVVVQSRSATANVHAIEALEGWVGMVAILVQNDGCRGAALQTTCDNFFHDAVR